MKTPTRVDVVVVGAGTAGAACAALCAQRGMSVLCLDRGPLEKAGARWVNGVPGSAFDRAGFARPEAPELRAGASVFHMVAGWGPARLVMADHGVLEVDMRFLVQRLQSIARERGAVVRGNVDVMGLVGPTLETSAGAINADWFVDAAGLAGPRLLAQPRVDPVHLCAAAQQVREIADPDGARAFFDRHRVGEGEVLCFTGIAGGYSILNVRYEGDELSMLTGSIPALGHPSGTAIIEQFVAAQPWVGRELFGGARAIPLRRPHDAIGSGRVALLGDAACQVFPAHGSGIGPGLVAARMLADALASGEGPRGYATAWMREHGGLLAGYDLFRRLSQHMTAGDIDQLMTSGAMDVDLARSGLAQQFPRPKLSTLPRRAMALARAPRLAARMGDVVARMMAARALYAAYPDDDAGLPAWSRRVARLFRESPDVV